MRQALGIVVAVAILVLAWPRPLGGATSYVVVSGTSMAPTYASGDLVVARTASAYDTGDVIAFRTVDGDVIHRIVGGDAETGFVTQGDNVDRVDPYRPVPSDVRGRAVLHLPRVGAWGLRVVRAVPAPVLAAGAILLAMGGTGADRRRRRARGTTGTSGEDAPVGTTQVMGPRLRVAATCVVAAVVLLPSAVLAWRVPAAVALPADEAPVRHTLDVGVFGIADGTSALYPEGRSEPITADDDGQVPDDAPRLQRDLLTELRVAVRHSVLGGDEVTGAGRVDVTLVTGSGTRVPLAGLPSTTFTGSFEREVEIDLDAVDAALATFREETGLDTDTAQLEVRPVVASDDGATIDPAPLVVALGAEVLELTGPLRTVVTPEGTSTTVAGSASLLGLSLPTWWVRGIATGGVLVLLAAAAVLARRELRDRPELRISFQHGARLVDVASDARIPGERVAVTSVEELARVARRDGRSILHQLSPDGTHRYFVPDEQLTYEFAIPGAVPVTTPDTAAPQLLTEPAAPALDTPVTSEVEPAPVADVAAGTTTEAESQPTTGPVVVDLDALTDEAPVAARRPTGVRDYLHVTTSDLQPGRTVAVEDFAELTRIWMRDTTAPGRLRRRRLPDGSTRYSVVRNGREFVYVAPPGSVRRVTVATRKEVDHG